jgi:hypothetical protein
VTGLIAQHPRLGGITWHYIQYALGLARLGHDVYYIEDSGEWPYNFDGGSSGRDWIVRDCTDNVRHLAKVMSRFGLNDKWAYHSSLESRWFGLSDFDRNELLKSADLLINVSGTLEHVESYRRVPKLVYIDTDPVITQIKWNVDANCFRARVDAHDKHFSFGECFSSGVPGTPVQWRPTRQPVVLTEWDPKAQVTGAFTTVMSWTSYKPLVYSGQTFGQKDIQFKRFLHLPSRLPSVQFVMALSSTEHSDWWTNKNQELPSSHNGEETCRSLSSRELLGRHGWHVVNAIEFCGDMDRYRRFIQSSKAEWSVAKDAYVLGQPGWFSERSACYLAAGRPAIVQETGFSRVLPVGEGIITFTTMDEAVAAVEEIQGEYARHTKAAREIAEEYFGSECVLERLLIEALN